MRKAGERVLIVSVLLVPMGGFTTLFGWLGLASGSEREEILLIMAAALATTALLTGGWIAWRRIHGRSWKGPLLLGLWLAGWLVALFVRANLDWVREERRRGGVLR